MENWLLQLQTKKTSIYLNDYSHFLVTDYEKIQLPSVTKSVTKMSGN
jgi:hypothetical protein